MANLVIGTSAQIIVVFNDILMGFHSGKESANAEDTRDASSVSGKGRPPGEGNGNPLQYSCLENSMDRGAWRATAHGVVKSCTQALNTAHSTSKGDS